MKRAPSISAEVQLLRERMASLELRVQQQGDVLVAALEYCGSDPHSSLTKSRVVLEKLMLVHYQRVLGRPPRRPMLVEVLADKAFTSTIPRRILARVNAVRELSNLGPHGEDVEPVDAIRVLKDLLDILEWHAINFGPEHSTAQRGGGSIEILPALRARFPRMVRKVLLSVAFCQDARRCYLETRELTGVHMGLNSELIRREDLHFVIDEVFGEDEFTLFFNPAASIEENARRFVEDLGVVGIANCTNLLAGAAVDRAYRREMLQTR